MADIGFLPGFLKVLELESALSSGCWIVILDLDISVRILDQGYWIASIADTNISRATCLFKRKSTFIANKNYCTGE
jgi:hypothetical protein